MKLLFKALSALLLVVVALGFAPQIAQAQSTVGSIYGAVTDPSGAAIPGSKVVVTDLHTGVTQTNVTNGKA